jgi:hypothetical protein
MLERMERFRSVFTPRIAALATGASQQGDEEAEE